MVGSGVITPVEPLVRKRSQRSLIILLKSQKTLPKKNFKIIPQELKMYQHMGLALPRLCPNCRHLRRIHLRNPRRLWKRQCMCTQPSHNHSARCPNQFETSYSPDTKELVYCELCYQKEIV